MPDQFAQMWKKAKEDFGGKKPSEKILLWTRKSGVREAAIGLDKALANIDLANLKPLKTARNAFEKAKTSYMKTLEAAMKEKGATDLSKSKCQNLAATLSKMEDIFEQSSVDCKSHALDAAIVKLTTQKKVPEDTDVNYFLHVLNNHTVIDVSVGSFKTLHEWAQGFKQAKKLAEAIKTLVLPEIDKYCKSFGVKTFKDLPCDKTLKEEGSRLANLHKLYQTVTDGDLETIIAATQVNATIRHKKANDDFNAYRKTIIDLMNNDKLNRAIRSEEKPIGDSFKEVNKALDVYINGLRRQLELLKPHAQQLSLDNGPILTLIETLDEQKRKPFESQTTGEDVRKWLSGISKGMGEAIKPFEKFKFPS